ncbi:MAG: hypothetical protein ACQESK_02600 [Bacteroidota bacterium]
MIKIRGIILTLLIASNSFCISQITEKELCAINLLGAKVYEKPNFNSKILTELQVGKIIKIEKSTDLKDSLKISENFSLKGVWYKAKTMDGFIFSSDFTAKNIEVEKTKHALTRINILGKLLDEKTEEETVKTENGKFPKHYKYKYYENATYISTAFDGCFDHLTNYKNLTLNEVYHQMLSDYAAVSQTIEGKKIRVPEFKEKSGNIIKFEGGGATQDLQIKIIDNKKIEVSSYDCT